jgi:hypothetical protein
MRLASPFGSASRDRATAATRYEVAFGPDFSLPGCT